MADRKDGSEEKPELFFALVYPIGTNSKRVEKALASALSEVAYGPPTKVHIIDGVAQGKTKKVYDDYISRMKAGTDLGKDLRRKDAMALVAIQEVSIARREHFPKAENLEESVWEAHPYILRSLKRPPEVHTLRDTYGKGLFVIAAHSSEASRRAKLTRDIRQSSGQGGAIEGHQSLADELMAKDKRESDDEYGQRVSDTFPLSDVFVDADDTANMERSLRRFVELLFGYPFHTPTKDEYGMSLAFAASLRSADLSRQVGAAIAAEDGEVIALGTNEVPRAGGGVYWPDDDPDKRDFIESEDDLSTSMKRDALVQIINQMKRQGIAVKAADSEKIWKAVQGTDLMNVGEFGRAVHAEMAAIVDAARRGVAVKNCTLYTTTFPCSVCARHIVAAGISRIVYNEPYPKSLASYLHDDSISLDSSRSQGKVRCDPFVGVAPSNYSALFSMSQRKDDKGRLFDWNGPDAFPRLSQSPIEYLRQEKAALEALAKARKNQERREAR